jgi:GxxExxY protein
MRERSPANWCSARVLDAALRVHRTLGPGLLESAYRACLAHELTRMGLAVREEVAVPLRYEGLALETGYRLDLLVGELVVVEVKAIAALKPVHSAQLLTYLRLANYPLGMLFNFHSMRLMESYVRMVNNL